jgi:hypothetical protein
VIGREQPAMQEALGLVIVDVVVDVVNGSVGHGLYL